MSIANSKNFFLHMLNNQALNYGIVLDESYGSKNWNKQAVKQLILLRDFYIFLYENLSTYDSSIRNDLRNGIYLVRQMINYQSATMQMLDIIKMSNNVISSSSLPFDYANIRYNALINKCDTLPDFSHNDVGAAEKILLSLNARLYCYLSSIKWNEHDSSLSPLFRNFNFIKENVLNISNNLLPLMYRNILETRHHMQQSVSEATSCVFGKFASLVESEMLQHSIPIDSKLWEESAIKKSLTGLKTLIDCLDSLYDQFEHNFQGSGSVKLYDRIMSVRMRLAELASYYSNLCSAIMGVAWSSDLHAMNTDNAGTMQMKHELYREQIRAYQSVLSKFESFDICAIRDEIFDLNIQIISNIESGAVTPRCLSRSPILSYMDVKNLDLDIDMMTRIDIITDELVYKMFLNNVDSDMSRIFIKDALCIFAHSDELIGSANDIGRICSARMKSSLSRLTEGIYRESSRELQSYNLDKGDRGVDLDIEFSKRSINRYSGI
ncbi:hypothetical protein CAXC1_80043 [Candidatus Xenohaliotis californiensis]|uniref:Uncharacterized protein n=1 Tax=Candidatus Xenohaliotis californiensis TaxID=84677 RepID=A0ABP0EXZ5_9RICK|nr:hypothetical protein CAXC1_80043 [Candidatus Xenohaliotis californiensis]